MTCTCCQTPLTGGTDTFGQVGQEMCQECWWALREESRIAWVTEMDRAKHEIQSWDSEIDALVKAIWQADDPDDEQFYRAEIDFAYVRLNDSQDRLRRLQS